MRNKRPYVICAKDRITKTLSYVSNSKAKDGSSPETSSDQTDALKFDSEEEAKAFLDQIGKPKGFSARKI